MLLEELEELTREKAPGPLPSFSILHMLKMLELIATKGPVGRNKLSKELKLGEGATRTMIERLAEKEMLTILKEGCVLTEKGKKMWTAYSRIFPKKIRLAKNELTLSDCNIALLVKDCGDKVTAGMEQRDAAVVVGAKSATTLLVRDGKLIIPVVSDSVAKDFPKANKQIMKSLKPEEKDVIVVSGADTWEKAEYGVLATSLTFLEKDCS